MGKSDLEARRTGETIACRDDSRGISLYSGSVGCTRLSTQKNESRKREAGEKCDGRKVTERDINQKEETKLRLKSGATGVRTSAVNNTALL